MTEKVQEKEKVMNQWSWVNAVSSKLCLHVFIINDVHNFFKKDSST